MTALKQAMTNFVPQARTDDLQGQGSNHEPLLGPGRGYVTVEEHFKVKQDLASREAAVAGAQQKGDLMVGQSNTCPHPQQMIDQDNEADEKRMMRHAFELGCKRAETVFFLFGAYDAMMIVTLLLAKPSFDDFTFSVTRSNVEKIAWFLLTSFFVTDVALATVLLKKIAYRSEHNCSDLLNPIAAASFDAFRNYWSSLKTWAMFNLISNTMTLCVWILHRYISASQDGLWLFGFVTMVRLVKLRPVCQFWDSLTTDDTLALGVFGRNNNLAKPQTDPNEFNLGDRQPSKPRSSEWWVGLAILLVVASGVAWIHQLPQEPSSSVALSVLLLTESDCPSKGGYCSSGPNGDCTGYGMLIGVLSGCFQTAIGSVFNRYKNTEAKGECEDDICHPKNPVPAIALLMNWIICIMGGAINAGLYQCKRSGMIHGLEGSLCVPGFVLAMCAACA
jgi:hypothetical protein